jgi:hypothetical protein
LFFFDSSLVDVQHRRVLRGRDLDL